MVNVKLVTVSLALGEGMARNTIFAWPFLQTIKASIMTENNDLVSRLLEEQFRLEIMFPQRETESPKKSEVIPVSLPASFQGKQENMKVSSSMNSRVELKKTVIHQHHIPSKH